MGFSQQQPEHTSETTPAMKIIGSSWKWCVSIAAMHALAFIALYGLPLLFGIIGIGTSPA